MFWFLLLWNTFRFSIIPAPLILMTVSCGALRNHALRAAACVKTLELPFSPLPPAPLCTFPLPCAHSGGGHWSRALQLGVPTRPCGNRVFNHSRKHTWLASLLGSSWWNILCPLHIKAFCISVYNTAKWIEAQPFFGRCLYLCGWLWGTVPRGRSSRIGLMPSWKVPHWCR